ncbi:crotonase/enoyl-CoA hydratase family protein [Methylopila sp. Yamaguchi]|uniref:crotonase/enoyl-CoA hydratase family protein n=1 Tax=Methylopila sp. Yamaguchi TaxID=1437817 RepID=UPI000CB24697|nr:crotonase/enoyl-CoA hydratase family protein [Methylopila sp. Yamaguchi]GBD48915.1 enoyl-CoA hydratase/isomerase [Methylopila sp. Yamaguchi]
MATSIGVPGYRPFFGLELARARLNAMTSAVKGPQAAPTSAGFGSDSYDEIEVEYDASLSTCWCWMNPAEAPSFTPGLLRDISAHQRAIREAFTTRRPDAPAPLKQWVLASRLSGIFNLGGDLERFAGWIRARDHEALTAYAHACIDVLHENAVAFDKPVVTVALVQGDALGGGFEAALSCDVIVAERGVKFGLPEILFNLFPGMGAYSLLARRIGAAQAERMIMSGKLYTAEELHALGVVQVLAEPGDGVAETHRLLTRNLRRHNGLSAIYRAGRRVTPVPYEELRDVTELWVETALNLSDSDLRKMERLTTAQDKRVQASLEIEAARAAAE